MTESTWNERPEGWWRAVTVIDLPDGTLRHPKLPERLQGHLDRPSVMDLSYPGVLVAFPLDADQEESAHQEAREVSAEIASFLGLGISSVVELEVSPPFPHLGSA